MAESDHIDPVLAAVLDMKGDVGEIKGTVDTIKAAIPDIYARVNHLETVAAKQKGAATVWSMFAHGASAAAGAVATILAKKVL